MSRQRYLNSDYIGFSHPPRMNGQPAFADFGSILSVAGPIVSGLFQGKSADKALASQERASEAAIAETREDTKRRIMENAPFLRTGTAANKRLSELLGLSSEIKAPQGGYQWNGNTYPNEDALRRAITANYYKESGGLDPNHPDVQASIAGHVSGIVSQQGVQGTDATSSDFNALSRKFTREDFDNDPVQQLSTQFGLDEGRKAISNLARATGTLNTGGTLKALTRFGTDYAGSKAGESYNRFVNDQNNYLIGYPGFRAAGRSRLTKTPTRAQMLPTT